MPGRFTRAAHAMAAHASAPTTHAPWVDAGSLHRNLDIRLPEPVRSTLVERAQKIISTAVTADSAALGLHRQWTLGQMAFISVGRAQEDRTPPTVAPAPGPGCER